MLEAMAKVKKARASTKPRRADLESRTRSSRGPAPPPLFFEDGKRKAEKEGALGGKKQKAEEPEEEEDEVSSMQASASVKSRAVAARLLLGECG